MSGAISIKMDSIITIAIFTVAITLLVYGITVISQSKVALGALFTFASLIILTIALSRTPMIAGSTISTIGRGEPAIIARTSRKEGGVV